jgi:ArsR family transcriptional regulator
MRNAVKTLKAMADPTRLRILRLLLRRDLCVCELMFILKMEQSRISHQLRILRDAGLVEDKREGKWMIYRVLDKARPNLELLLNQLLKKQLRESEEAFSDLGNLELCLRQDVRRKHSSSARQSRENS